MKEKRHWLEWAVLGVAAVVVAMTFAFLVYEGFQAQEGEMPSFEVTVGNTTPVEGFYRVQVRVRNKGYVTAEHLKVQVDSVEFEIDRLAGGAHHDGYVLLQQAPQQLQARVTTFQLP